MEALLVLLCILANASSKEISYEQYEQGTGPTIMEEILHLSDPAVPVSVRIGSVCKGKFQKPYNGTDGDDTNALKCIKKGAVTTAKQLIQALQRQEAQVTELQGFEIVAYVMGNVSTAVVKLLREYEDQNQLIYNLNNLSDLFMSLDVNVGSAFMSVLNCTKQLTSTKTISHQVGGAFLEAQLFSSDSLAIYSYLTNLFEVLSDYKIQSDKTIAFDFDPENVNFPALEKKLKITVPHSVSLANLNTVKKTHIYNILNATLNHKTEITCSSGNAKVMGSFVLLSEVVKNSCFNVSNQIEIYAANKLFIDADITKNGSHIAMASPIWDVQGKRMISLDGAKGSGKQKATYNSMPGSTGNAGEPGNAGGIGGEFFGIGEIFLNSKQLTISAKGGDGGDGAEGGDAFNWNGQRNDSMPCYVKFNHWYNSAVTDIPNCKAANGGIGGVGGKPGPGGYVKFWDFGGDSAVAVATSSGSTGAGGKGGNAGEVYVHEYYISDSYQQTIDQLFKGSQGAANSNNANIKNPEPPISQIFPSTSSIINFKKVLRKYESVALESQQRAFMDKLENHKAVLELYNNSAPFFEEFEDLENDYRFKEVNSTIYYDSLLRRARNFTCDEAKDKFCQDFRYLRLALMSIVAEGNDEYFVVNVHDYLQLLLKQLQQYDTSIRELDIRQKNEDYISDLLDDIIEARNFIAQDVVPEITDVTEQMKTEMNDLVELVEEKLEDAEALKDELEKQKEKLKKLGALNIFFNVAGCLSNALSFIPGAGIVGTMLGVGFDVGSTIVSDKIDEIQQSAVDAAGEIDAVFIAQLKFMQKHLDELYTQVNSSQSPSDDSQFVKFEIEEFRALLSGANADFLKAKGKIQKDIADYKNRVSYGSLEYCMMSEKNGTNDDDPVKRLSGIIEAAGDGFHDIYNAVGQNNDAKSKLDQALQETDQEIAGLKSYESIIYSTLMPMIEELKEGMVNATNQTDLSHVEIDVKSMKIDNTLSDFKVQMETMVYAFDDPVIKPTLMGCIDKLRSAMKTAMSIFDRIANFRDQAKLVNFITDIQLDNSAMSSRQIEYEILTKTNLITKEFGLGIRAFIQFSFPFASLYLDRFEIGQSESQNDTVILNAANQKIEFLSDELVIDATVVRNQGYTIFTQINFDASNKDQPPFHVWKNKKYNAEISQLLQGKQVTITAELPAAETYANACKFKEVGIHFLSSNKTIQKKIDKQMDDFLVTMTHLGSSYFQCTDKKFVIHHNKIKMVHAMNRVQDDYGHADINTLILRNNPAMCSPYTTWLMQISHKQGCNECFSDLEEFIAENLDLALEGDGQFIDIPNGKDICGHNTDKYYELVEDAS